jgi:hypothetical protein
MANAAVTGPWWQRRQANTVFFLGFQKNDRYNIDQLELRVLQEIGETFLAFTDAELEHALRCG